jgi:hypothetical protein
MTKYVIGTNPFGIDMITHQDRTYVHIWWMYIITDNKGKIGSQHIPKM